MKIDLNEAGEQRERQPAAHREMDQRPKIESALTVLPADCDRDTWFRVLAAIQDELGEDGRDIARTWSMRWNKFEEARFNETWRSCTSGRGITVGTLFKLAQEYGWSDTVPAREMSPEEVELRRRSKVEADKKNSEYADYVQARAREWSAAIKAAAQPARPDHPYLVKKGVSPTPTMLEIDAAELEGILGYAPQAGGHHLAGRVLIILLERFGETGSCSMEMIDESGRKTALRGPGTKSGAHGRLDSLQGVPDVVLVGEGAATTLTALEALCGHRVAAFMTSSNSNMPSVATAIRAQYPQANIIVLADLQKDTGEPDPHAVKASQAVNGFLAVPDFGPNWTAATGTDFNDLARVRGPMAVLECIEAARVHERRRRFTISTRDEIISRPFARWTIKGVMLEKGVGAMHGPSTVGKSFVAVDMAAHIAEGRDWFGFRTQKRPVAYFVFEGKAGFSARIQAWERANGRRYPAGVVEVTIPDPGQVDDVSKASFDLRNVQDVQDLCADILDAVGPGAVVILDTLNQAAPGMEENGSVDYGLCLSAAHAIERAIGGFTLFVAHPGKDTSKGLRGHYSLFAGLDLNLELEEVRKDELLFAWIIRKVKDGQDGIKRHFRREVIELGQDADGDPVTSCAIHPDPEADSEGSMEKAKTPTITPVNWERFERFRQAAMERGFLDDSGAFIGIDRMNWREHHQENHPNPKGPEATRAAFNDAVKGLKKSILVCETADGLFQFDGPGAETQIAILSEAIRARRGWSK